jgi:hypothetical protein
MFKVLDDKLKLCYILIVWMMIQMIAFGSLGVFDSPYFSVGPNDRLFLVQAPINTWGKWLILILFRVFGTIFEVATGDMLGPWIMTKLQDEDKLILPYQEWKCKLIIQIFYGYHDINSMFGVFLALTQADIAIVVIICQSVILQNWTIPRWFKNKHFELQTIVVV